jgi:hypothetical protein
MTSNQDAPSLKSAAIVWSMPTDWYNPAVNFNYRLDGVNVYVGTSPGGPYDYAVIDIGYTTWYALSDYPDDGTMYYVVLTGYGYNLDTNQEYESAYSNEISF